MVKYTYWVNNYLRVRVRSISLLNLMTNYSKKLITTYLTEVGKVHHKNVASPTVQLFSSYLNTLYIDESNSIYANDLLTNNTQNLNITW